MANKEALQMALMVATIEEIEAHFHVSRYDDNFMIAIAEINKAVYGKDE